MKRLSLTGVAGLAVAGAMASGQLYLVTKDGKSIAYPIENVDSVTFSEPGKIKSLSLDDLIKKASLADSLEKALLECQAGPYTKYAGVYRLSDKSLLCIKEDGKAEWLKDLGKGKADNNTIRVNVTFSGVDFDPNASLFVDGDTMRVSYSWNAYYTSPYDNEKHTSTFPVEFIDNGSLIIDGNICKNAMTFAAYESFRDSVLAVYEPVFTEGEKNGEGYMVDLGLPSGLKWATWNIGASKVDDYGSYYTWGEVKTKESFSSDDYFTLGSTTKDQIKAGIIDSLRNLTSQYDAATVNWGKEWRMPTRKEYVELIENCKFYWTHIGTMYGMKVVGPNGNKIFLPAGGMIGEHGYYEFNENCYYWSSSLTNSDYSAHVPAEFFWAHYLTTSYNQSNAYYGKSVRAVAVENTPSPYAKFAGVYSLKPENIVPTVNKEYLVIKEDGTAEWIRDLGKGRADNNMVRVDVTFQGVDYDPSPEVSIINDTLYVSYKSHAWYLSPMEDKEITEELYIEPLSNGTEVMINGTIKKPAMTFAQYESFRDSVLAVYEPVFTEGEKHGNGYMVDLGLPSGLKWATWNVGANKVDDYGSYYTWGEVEPKDYYSVDDYFTRTMSQKQMKEAGIIDTLLNLTAEHDAATVNMGAEWRMPSRKEYLELINNCKFYWTHIGNVNGMKIVGPNGNKIFLPAGGSRPDERKYMFNVICEYWTASSYYGSSSLWETHVPAEYFWSHCVTTSWNQQNAHCGNPVRAVAIEK